MACPEGSYAALLKTASGLTPSNPYTIIPNLFAMADWRAVLERVLSLMEAAFHSYKTAKPEGDWTPHETTQYNAVVERYNGVRRRADEIGPAWNIVDWDQPSAGEYITTYVGLATDAACVWQQIEEAHGTLSKSRTTPVLPPDPSKLPTSMSFSEKALWLGGIVGGGFLLVYGLRSYQQKRG